MSLAGPCNPCGSTPVTVQVPGPTGPQGSPGAIGPAGPAGTIPVPVSSYNTGGTNVLATSGAATANGPIFGNNLPQIILPVLGGTYLLRARTRVDGSGATLTTQTLTIQLYSVTEAAAVGNTTRIFKFVPCTTTSGTMAELITPDVIYKAQATNEVIQLYGVVSAATGAGTLVCVEADMFAVQLY